MFFKLPWAPVAPAIAFIDIEPSLEPEPSSYLNPAQAQLEGDARIFVLLKRFVDGIEKFRN